MTFDIDRCITYAHNSFQNKSKGNSSNIEYPENCYEERTYYIRISGLKKETTDRIWADNMNKFPTCEKCGLIMSAIVKIMPLPQSIK